MLRKDCGRDKGPTLIGRRTQTVRHGRGNLTVHSVVHRVHDTRGPDKVTLIQMGQVISNILGQVHLPPFPHLTSCRWPGAESEGSVASTPHAAAMTGTQFSEQSLPTELWSRPSGAGKGVTLEGAFTMST